MIISLDNVSKRYSKTWILRNISYTFNKPAIYGISGSNGSGKSTLLRMLSGFLSPSAGTIEYRIDGKVISRSDIYKHVTYAAPYISLPATLSIKEVIDFHFKFKSMINKRGTSGFFETLGLNVPMKSKITELSSGQAQRLHIALSIMSNAEVLLLDEPSSYLDADSQMWLQGLLRQYAPQRLVVIASNHIPDLAQCTEHIDVTDFH